MFLLSGRRFVHHAVIDVPCDFSLDTGIQRTNEDEGAVVVEHPAQVPGSVSFLGRQGFANGD